MFSLTSTYSLRNILLCGILILLYNAECGTGPPTTESTVATTTDSPVTTTTGSTVATTTDSPVTTTTGSTVTTTTGSTVASTTDSTETTTTGSTVTTTTGSTETTTTGSTVTTTTGSTVTTTTGSTVATTTDSTVTTTTGSTVATTTDSTETTTTGSTVTTTTGSTVATTTDSTETTTTGLTVATTTGSTDTSPTSPPVHSCASSPCRDNATCVEIFQSYTCDCGFNFYYDYTDDSCKEGKSFGGELTMKIEFDPAMTNKKSEVYMALEKNVTNIFNKSFSNIEGYEETKILEVRKGSVITTLFNTFTMSAQVNESMIQEAMENNGFYSFTSVYGCNLKKCDPYTTISCYQPPHGLAVCICRDGFFRNERYDTKCQESCIAQCKGENEYLVRDGDKCDCKCQAGYKRRDDKCESCPFGYGGIDCNDAFQLSTVVIGVIAGVIIISMTIGLIYTSIRLKDAKYDEGQPLVNEAKEGSPTMIPRINMGNNPMMMNSLTRDNDEKSYQKGWNTYDNPTMENEYSRKRYY